MYTTALASRSGSNPVGVRNCDHPLDLRIRSERRRRASASLDAPRSEPPSFDSLALEAKCLDRLRSRSAQDLSTSDSDLIPFGWRQRASFGPSSMAIHTDLTGGQLGRSRRSQG